MRNSKAYIGIALVLVLIVIASVIIVNRSTDRMETTNSSQVQYTLKPYTGLGSGVLKHGTVLKEEYKNPASISGVLDISGIWILEEVK